VTRTFRRACVESGAYYPAPGCRLAAARRLDCGLWSLLLEVDTDGEDELARCLMCGQEIPEPEREKNRALNVLMRLSYDLIHRRLGYRPQSWDKLAWQGVLTKALSEFAPPELRQALQEYIACENQWVIDHVWPARQFQPFLDRWAAKRERISEIHKGRVPAETATEIALRGGPRPTEGDLAAAQEIIRDTMRRLQETKPKGPAKPK